MNRIFSCDLAKDENNAPKTQMSMLASRKKK